MGNKIYPHKSKWINKGKILNLYKYKTTTNKIIRQTISSLKIFARNIKKNNILKNKEPYKSVREILVLQF